MATIRAVCKIILFALLSAAVVGTQTVLLPFYKGPASYWVPLLWQKGTCRIFGIKVRREGTPVGKRPAIYVSNHVSYMDIPVVGSLVMASFVARGDMESWPIFGYMGKMQQSVYISRKREDAEEGRKALHDMLAAKRSLIIFAEGTSTPGTSVLPFKSSLFGLALEHGVSVQPMTISLISVGGKPVTDAQTRDLYAWHGDMTLYPHIWAFAKLGGAELVVRFHPPRDASVYKDRKALCRDCYEDVAGGLVIPALARAA